MKHPFVRLVSGLPLSLVLLVGYGVFYLLRQTAEAAAHVLGTFEDVFNQLQGAHYLHQRRLARAYRDKERLASSVRRTLKELH